MSNCYLPPITASFHPFFLAQIILMGRGFKVVALFSLSLLYPTNQKLGKSRFCTLLLRWTLPQWPLTMLTQIRCQMKADELLCTLINKSSEFNKYSLYGWPLNLCYLFLGTHCIRIIITITIDRLLRIIKVSIDIGCVPKWSDLQVGEGLSCIELWI